MAGGEGIQVLPSGAGYGMKDNLTRQSVFI
jgi:hypothetical protein